MGFELMVLASARANTGQALDRSATVTGFVYYLALKLLIRLFSAEFCSSYVGNVDRLPCT
jgi:hypothetical protein